MDAIELIRGLYDHRVWVDHLLLDAAESLSEEQRLRSFPIGRGSIWQSLLHLYAAQWGWLEVLHGNADATLPGDLPDGYPGNQEGEGGIESLSELKEKWLALEARWAEYYSGLDASTLDDEIRSASIDSAQGTTHATRQADVLLHLYTYCQYTTAQVMNMLRHVGADPMPDVMLITLARQQA